jgi:hypothetical protein
VIKNHIAKKGPKGMVVLNFFEKPFFIFDHIMSQIHITLQVIYIIIVHAKLRETHNINHIKIAILRSHHPIQVQFDIIICRKKNINIHNAQITQFIIVISDKSTQ